VVFFESRLGSFLYDKEKDLIKIYFFSMVLPYTVKTGKNSSIYTFIKIVSGWTSSGTSLQCHMMKVHVMRLREQLKG
jgi:hypothetical protein